MNTTPWIEKYRPDNFDKIILDEMNRKIMMKMLETNQIPNMIFYGPPGTGKTTVANLMANIYAELGILKKNRCTVVKREDLIGQFLGETTLKTMDTLESCKNGVMLIDEAYSLGSPDNRDSYAKEAIDCINQYLTENVDKLICIIAGYKEELNLCFFSQNKGLRRRFPWTFTIKHFTTEELAQILINKVNESEYYELSDNIDIDFIAYYLHIKLNLVGSKISNDRQSRFKELLEVKNKNLFELILKLVQKITIFDNDDSDYRQEIFRIHKTTDNNPGFDVANLLTYELPNNSKRLQIHFKNNADIVMVKIINPNIELKEYEESGEVINLKDNLVNISSAKNFIFLNLEILKDLLNILIFNQIYNHVFSFLFPIFFTK